VTYLGIGWSVETLDPNPRFKDEQVVELTKKFNAGAKTAPVSTVCLGKAIIVPRQPRDKQREPSTKKDAFVCRELDCDLGRSYAGQRPASAHAQAFLKMRHACMKPIVIPKQAQDKHKETLKEEACFVGTTDQAAADEAQATDGRDEETSSASRTHIHTSKSKSGGKGSGGRLRDGGSVSCVGLAADDRGEAPADAVVL
jgi:hypothetical protein